VSSSFGLSFTSATWAKTPFFTAEGHDFFFTAASTFQPQETVCRNSAFNERFELIYDILWKRAIFGFTRLNEAVQVLVYNLEAGCNLPPVNLIFNCNAFRQDTGFCDPIALDQGIQETLKWALAHPDVLGERPDYERELRTLETYERAF
jgi:hypothetical protein